MPRFDQHFLQAESYIQKIADAVKPHAGEMILEVGPGMGALTRYLLEKPFPYTGIEIDARCLTQLRQLPHAEGAKWIHGDFLRVELPTQPLYFVSNLPYSISGPALFRVLAHRMYIREGIIMLQAEVAQRLYARPGSRAYGRLSVLFQSIYETERLLRVPPGAFRPPPKVWSEVVRFMRRPKLPIEEWEPFAEVVRAAFRQPRQTLGRNLRDSHLPLPPEWTTRRPHQLSIEDYLMLWRGG